MRRRDSRRPPDLTSLFDVLFIVIFAALIRAAAVENAAARSPAPPALPVIPPTIAALHQRALADLGADLAARTPLVVRIAVGGAGGGTGTGASPGTGTGASTGAGPGLIEALEVDGQRIAVGAPLVDRSPDPDVALVYAGDRVAERRICHIVAARLGVRALSRYLVIMAPALPLVDLPHALHDGLHRDLDRCLSEQHGLAALVDPAALASPPEQGTP
jgi:hypothetical protein